MLGLVYPTELISVPIYYSKVVAGFPSPAEDYIEGHISLDKQLISNPAATFLIRVAGDSMIEAGLVEGDTLIVDRSVQPSNNKIVIAVVNGEFTVKRLKIKNGCSYLVPENHNYAPILLDGTETSIWGVVTYVIKKI